MWRRPLAYGHATATRIFRGGLVRLTAANHMESTPGDPARREPSGSAEQREHEQRSDDASDTERDVRPVRSRVVARSNDARRRGRAWH